MSSEAMRRCITSFVAGTSVRVVVAQGEVDKGDQAAGGQFAQTTNRSHARRHTTGSFEGFGTFPQAMDMSPTSAMFASAHGSSTFNSAGYSVDSHGMSRPPSSFSGVPDYLMMSEKHTLLQMSRGGQVQTGPAVTALAPGLRRNCDECVSRKVSLLCAPTIISSTCNHRFV